VRVDGEQEPPFGSVGHEDGGNVTVIVPDPPGGGETQPDVMVMLEKDQI
jgi:hypothetical protein